MVVVVVDGGADGAAAAGGADGGGEGCGSGGGGNGSSVGSSGGIGGGSVAVGCLFYWMKQASCLGVSRASPVPDFLFPAEALGLQAHSARILVRPTQILRLV